MRSLMAYQTPIILSCCAICKLMSASARGFAGGLDGSQPYAADLGEFLVHSDEGQAYVEDDADG